MPSPRSTGFPVRDLTHFGPDSHWVPDLTRAQAYCRSLARRHYENFVVTSCLIPRHVRDHFHPLYAFCRWADDLADETDPERAGPLLDWWAGLLRDLYEDRPVPHPVFTALRPTVREFGLPERLFSDLLSAFRQDLSVREYATRAQLLDYCRRSANPVGRMILHLARRTDPESLRLSDAICTGLQLANFWQDVARDWHEKRRVYLPREDRLRHGVADFPPPGTTPELQALLRDETAWARGFFDLGRPLVERLPPEFRRAVRLFHAGGAAILDEIARVKFRVWERRPTLSAWRKLCLVCVGL